MTVNRPVILTGPPASGKSTLARNLAARSGETWVDTDAAIEREAGASIAEIFSREGEAGFRAREKTVFARLLDEAHGIIATGGGTLVDRASRHAALRRGMVIALDAPIDVLLSRASHANASSRPLLANDARNSLARLLETRAESYAEAHAVIHAGADEALTADEAAMAIAGLRRETALVVPLGRRSYRVVMAPVASLAPRVVALQPSAVIAVSDSFVERLPAVKSALEGLAPRSIVTLNARGDRDKNLDAVSAIWDAALDAQIDRSAILVGIGGGVVTDLTGFAAATVLRGVRYASAPTTLLSMVDASVGGKTGFDHRRGKNLIGAFHQPSLVVCDAAVLESLPARDVRAGLAEVAKIALVCDAALVAVKLWTTLRN